MIKTRFAPSPTGYIHLGNARTALFNFLLAKSQPGGCFLLRIEDSDAARSSLTLADELQQDLVWLGLTWDEGPHKHKEQNQGPYLQSERQSIYRHYYEELRNRGHVYPCFCTDQELLRMRKDQLAHGRPPRYTGHCRYLSREQIAGNQAQHKQSTLRFQVEPNKRLVFEDLIKGRQVFNSNDIGDFIIQRSDGSSAFFFCNAVDDALMGITHVLRGEDHLTNTPRQILLLQALGLRIPSYGHMPLIVNKNGTPLSKREDSLSIKDLHRLGYFPEALQNYLARLGHSYDQADFLSLYELATQFSLGRLGRSSAQYDDTQLFYWQKQALLHLAEDRLAQWMKLEKLASLVPLGLESAFIDLMRSTICFPHEVPQWARILFDKSFRLESVTEEVKDFLQTVDPVFWDTVLDILKVNPVSFKIFLQDLQKKLNIKGKGLFVPLRLALTGCYEGPEMERLFSLMDRETIRERIQHAKDL